MTRRDKLRRDTGIRFNFNCANPIRHMPEASLPELKLINEEGKINGAENTTSPALILRGKVATRVFQERVQKEIVSAPFLTVRT